MSQVLEPTAVAVRTEGTLVVLQIGSAVLKMEYETALKISTWLRVRGKDAKRAAGDTSRHWTVIGNLEAVENGESPFTKKWQ